VKDGINNYLVHGDREAVNPRQTGTKSCALSLTIGPGETVTVRLALAIQSKTALPFGAEFNRIFLSPAKGADSSTRSNASGQPPDARNVTRQAFAGLLWSKQYYHYDVERWLRGDIAEPSPPKERKHGRNHEWTHLYNADVISMPDKWEYPWYAAWDLAFHCIPLALIDSDFAKEQLILMLREWYMHPNGQIPAYEWVLAMSILLCMRGRHGVSIKLNKSGEESPTTNSWSACFTSCCSTSPGG
jgi:hypothetical protein